MTCDSQDVVLYCAAARRLHASLPSGAKMVNFLARDGGIL
jgi:hypothetical protein